MSAIADRIREKLFLQSAFKHAFENENGEVVLQHLMKVSGILNPKIVTDANVLLVRQGQQHIVLSILRIIGKDPLEIAEQIKESMKHE